MFSSLSKLSPKHLLASYLSQSLAEFFDVDPESVETNLIQDAKVRLNGVAIKERRVGGGGGRGSRLIVSGSIESIEFAWVWDASALIKDVRLTVGGVNVHVRVVNSDEQGGGEPGYDSSLEPPAATAGAEAPNKGEDASAPSDWKQRYLQQIVDHLTLIVADATASVHLSDESQFVVELRDAKLITLSSAGEGAAEDLAQEAGLGSIEAWVERDGTRHTVLEPFGYRASVTRISGRRFLDGILSGLLVEGTAVDDVDASRAPSSVRVHAGVDQMAGLSSLREVLLLVGGEAAGAGDEDAAGAPLTSSVNEGAPRSAFRLPFRSMEVVLEENGANLRLAGCQVRYCTDASEFSVECRGGAWVDGTALSRDGAWVLDLVSSTLALELLPSGGEERDGDYFYSAHGDGGVAEEAEGARPFQLDLTLDTFEKVYRGVSTIMPQCADLAASAGGMTGVDAQSATRSAPEPAWSVKSTAPVAFRFTGQDGAWVEVLIKSPELGAGLFQCKSIDVCSNAGFSIHVPSVATDNQKRLCVDYRIAIDIDSMDTLNTLQGMWSQVASIVGDEPSSSGIPFDFSLAGVDVAVKEPQTGAVHASRVVGSGGELALGLLQVRNVSGLSLDASSLLLSLGDHQKASLSVDRITKLAYDKVDYLAAPIVGTTLLLENNDTLSMTCKHVHLRCPEQTVAAGNAPSIQEGTIISLPLSLDLTLEHLFMEVGPAKAIDVEGANLLVRPEAAGQRTLLDLEVKSVKASLFGASVTVGRTSTSVEICAAGSADSKVSLAGLGSLLSASVTVRDVSALSTTFGHLNKGLDVVEIAYDGRSATVQCNKILFCTKTDETPASTRSGATSSNLPFAVHLKATRIIIMEEFGPGLPGTCFDAIQVRATPGETELGIDAHCNYVQGRLGDANSQIDFSAKGVKLSLSKSLLDGKGDRFGLKQARVSLKELSTLSLPGKLKLVKPVCGLEVSLRNNSVDVRCSLAHVLYHTEFGAMQPDSNEDWSGDEDAEISFPFSITVNELILQHSSTAEIALKRFSTQYIRAPSSSSQSLHIGIASLNATMNADRYQVDDVNISTKWQRGGMQEVGNKISLPYLGSLSFAQVQLGSLNEVKTTFFSLAVPLHGPKLLFQEGFLVLELTELHVEVADAAAQEPHNNRQQSETTNLDLLAFPVGVNISNRLLLKTATGDVELFNLGVDYVPSPSSPGEMFVHCDRLVAGSMISAKQVDFHAHLAHSESAVTSALPGMSLFNRASLKMGEIDTILIEGHGRLSQPLRNALISYQDGFIATDLVSLQLECVVSGSLVLGFRNIAFRLQPDQFDGTLRVMTQVDAVSGRGDAAFSMTGVSIVSTVVPTKTSGALDKGLAISSLGYINMLVVDVSEIGSLNAAGLILISPVAKLGIRFDNGIFTVSCPMLCLRKEAKNRSPPVKGHQSQQPAELPFKASLSIEAFQIVETGPDIFAAQREVQCRSLDVTLDPARVQTGPGIGFQVICNDLKSVEGTTAIDVPRISVSGLIHLNDLAIISNLSVGIEKARLAAEFSMANWSGSLENERPQVIRLPYASIPKFELTLKYAGKVVNVTDSTIACEQFQGTANATLSQISKHYVGIVKRRIPYLAIAKTDVMGANVADSVGMMAGSVITHTSVVGATLGVASRDMVGSTLTMGKESRGASASDAYKFGDFSRGVVSSVKHAAKTGSEIRGGDSYQVGDFTKGTGKAVGEYASENRCRLAGVGGSVAGMAAGAALLGPVGWVAGNMIGGSAAKSSMAALTGDPKKKSDAEKTDSHHPGGEDLSSPSRSNAAATQHTPGSNQHQLTQSQQLSTPQRPSHSHTTAPPLAQPANIPNSTQQGYRFGDITRGIVAKGKKADGRDDKAGYKFGDFTRGLFS